MHICLFSWLRIKCSYVEVFCVCWIHVLICWLRESVYFSLLLLIIPLKTFHSLLLILTLLLQPRRTCSKGWLRSLFFLLVVQLVNWWYSVLLKSQLNQSVTSMPCLGLRSVEQNDSPTWLRWQVDSVQVREEIIGLDLCSGFIETEKRKDTKKEEERNRKRKEDHLCCLAKLWTISFGPYDYSSRPFQVEF